MIKPGGGKQDSRVRLTDAAEQALSDLRSRQESTQLRGMMVLKERVETEAREVSREEFSAFVTELNKRIFDLVKSDEPHEKLGGIRERIFPNPRPTDPASIQSRGTAWAMQPIPPSLSLALISAIPSRHGWAHRRGVRGEFHLHHAFCQLPPLAASLQRCADHDYSLQGVCAAPIPSPSDHDCSLQVWKGSFIALARNFRWKRLGFWSPRPSPPKLKPCASWANIRFWAI